MRKSNQCPNGWMQTVLGKVGDVSMCKRVLKHQTANFGDVPFFKIGTFGGVPDAYISQDLFNEYKQKYSYPKNGDVLISAAGTIGRLVVFDGIDAYFQDSNIVWIANDEKIALNKYLYYLYQTIRWRTSEGGIVSRLYNAEIRKTKICLPPLEEQEKIAQILATWDSAIEQLTDLIAEKQHQKKALMQRLLTGMQRLPGFNKPWKNVKLGDIGKITSGKSKSSVLVDDGLFTVVDMGAVSISGRLLEHKKTNLAEDFLQADDLIMPKDDIGGGNIIGKSILITENNKYVLGDHVFRLVVAEYPRFISYKINSFYVNKYMRRVCTGSAQLGLAKRDVEKCNLYIPADINEQKAIADVLMAADTEIDLLQQQLQAIAEQKQGLMQQLLTGNIRVKIDKK